MVNKVKNRRDDKRKGGFVYKPRTVESVKQRAEQKGGGFDSPLKKGFDSWRPKQGDNNIRILPPTWEDAEHYAYDVFVHRSIGPDNSMYLCPLKMKVGQCPICEAAKEAETAGEADEAKALKAGKQTWMWIIDRDEDKPNPVMFMASWTIDRDIAAITYNKKTGKVLHVDHPDEGYDIQFRREGQALKTKYFGFQIDRDATPIDDSDKVQDEILAFIEENPVPSVLNFFDEDYLEKVLSGTAQKKDEDLDEDDVKPKKKGRARDDDDDEEEEEEEKPKKTRVTNRRGEDEEEIDDDEDEKPKARRGRGSRDAEDDEDDDTRTSGRNTKGRRRAGDDDDEDEEEDEKPRGRRGARDEDEEEEEDEKPRRRRGRTGPEDDEEDTDDEKEEKPTKRVKRR